MKSLEDHNDQAAVSKYHINAPWLANRTAASSRMPSEKLESLYIHNWSHLYRTLSFVNLIPTLLFNFYRSQSKEDTITPYIYRPGVIPPQRHTLYQLIDIHQDDVQTLISVNNGNEKNCSVSV